MKDIERNLYFSAKKTNSFGGNLLIASDKIRDTKPQPAISSITSCEEKLYRELFSLMEQKIKEAFRNIHPSVVLNGKPENIGA